MKAKKRCRFDQPPLGYIAWHADAKMRYERGERQFKCPECNLYHWSSPLSKKLLTV